MSEESSRTTVMFVDDEENILLTLERLLMDEDYEIVTALSGEEALEKLKGLNNVGVIVSDQRMSGMNGAEFMFLSRDICPHCVRILLTGYSDINSTIDAINRGGAHRYLSKPWNDTELIQTIREALAQYRRDMEARHLNEVINQQKLELETWNENLKKRLLQNTATIREQKTTINDLSERTPLEVVYRTFDNMLEVFGDRGAVHARTVSILATDAARKLGLDAEEIAIIRLAALLHDLGKLGTLSASLHKLPNDLTESEAADYRQHPVRGAEMFAKVAEMGPVVSLIRGHHEAYNGSGFPDGLQGEEIPVGARLIAIADQIDKSARSVEKHRANYALMNARYHGGIQLDPHLIDKFRGIAGIVYYEGVKVSTLDEVEVTPENVVPGMILNRDVVGANGMLLMQRGTVLDFAKVALIRSQFQKNMAHPGIFVQVSEE
jgi:putative nucleotidyltransferase with HDIG domain